MRPPRPAEAIEPVSFEVPDSSLAELWSTVVEVGFFDLAPAFEDSSVRDGGFLQIRVSTDTVSHTVRARNVFVAELETLLAAVNRAAPDSVSIRGLESFRSP